MGEAFCWIQRLLLFPRSPRESGRRCSWCVGLLKVLQDLHRAIIQILSYLLGSSRCIRYLHRNFFICTFRPHPRGLKALQNIIKTMGTRTVFEGASKLSPTRVIHIYRMSFLISHLLFNYNSVIKNTINRKEPLYV